MLDVGDVLVASLPQANGQPKFRPVVVIRIMPKYGDLLIAGVSSQLHQELVNFDIPLLSNSRNGLVKDSILRLPFLTVLPASLMKRRLGKISVSESKLAQQRLAKYISEGEIN